MHDRRLDVPAVERDRETDLAVLDLLLIDARGPVADFEVARELGDELAVADSLARMASHGLIYRLNGFVFPSMAAVRAAALHE